MPASSFSKMSSPKVAYHQRDNVDRANASSIARGACGRPRRDLAAFSREAAFMTRSISNTAKHCLAPLSVLCLIGTTISLSAGQDYSDEYTQAFITRFGTICMAALEAVSAAGVFCIEKVACLVICSHT